VHHLINRNPHMEVDGTKVLGELSDSTIKSLCLKVKDSNFLNSIIVKAGDLGHKLALAIVDGIFNIYRDDFSLAH